MITWHQQRIMHFDANNDPVIYAEGVCLSTDNKPTQGIYNGTKLTEMDTGSTHMFSSDTNAWLELARPPTDADSYDDRVSPKDVNFRDYNGACIASYTIAEAQALTALPDAPTHKGLTFDGWNWTLAQVKALTRPMEIGACYKTDDGTTRLYVTISTKQQLSITLRFSVVEGGADVDWGDGNTSVTAEGYHTEAHEYASVGNYVIRIIPESGASIIIGATNYAFGVIHYANNTAQANRLRKVELGGNVTAINGGAFRNCDDLQTITMPAALTSIRYWAFACLHLQALTIPQGASLDSAGLQSSYQKMAYLLLPGSGITTTPTMTGDTALTTITIPDGVTTVGLLRNCTGLTELYIPASVASIAANTFAGCNYLVEIHFLGATPPTLANINAFPTDALEAIYVPYSEDHSVLVAYQNANVWSGLTDYLQEEPAA